MIDYLNIVDEQRSHKIHPTPIAVECTLDRNDSKKTLTDEICQIGTRIKVKWTKEEVGESGWKPGWYIAHVQGYDDEDEITVIYPSEPDCIYKNIINRSRSRKYSSNC